MVARGGMDSLRSPCGRTACVCRRCAPRMNCRHADFQCGVRRLLALYFNKTAGHPFPNLHHNAYHCRTQSHKTHANLSHEDNESRESVSDPLYRDLEVDDEFEWRPNLTKQGHSCRLVYLLKRNRLLHGALGKFELRIA